MMRLRMQSAFLLFWGWLAFRFISDWPRGVYASGGDVSDWGMNLSYFGLVPWLLMATPIILLGSRGVELLRRDSIVQAHVAFIGIQLLGYANSIARFGTDGLVAGAYILAVSASFLYTYILGLRLGTFHRAGALQPVMQRNVNVIVWAMIPTLLLGVFQALSGTARDVDGVMRVYGGTSSPNVFGGLLLAFIGILLWGGVHRLRPGRLLLGVTTIGCFVGCFSMSGFGAVIFAGGIYVLVRAATTGRMRVRISWVVAGLVALYILGLVAGTMVASRVGELQQNDNSLLWRIRTWATYIDALSDPRVLLFGAGLGVDHLGMDQEPHNEWLRVTAETGLLGLSFFLLTWVRLIKALRQVIALPDPELSRQATAFLGAVAGLMLWGLVDSVLRTAPSALLVWGAAGMLIGAARSYSLVGHPVPGGVGDIVPGSGDGDSTRSPRTA